MAKGKVIEKGPGLKGTIKQMQELASKGVLVGILGAGNSRDAEGGVMGTADIAAVHEFGRLDGTIPERSFLRSTIRVGRESYIKLLERLARAIMMKKTDPTTALGLVGEKIRGDVQKTFNASGADEPWEPNSDKTIARKGSSKPLIDTAQLKQSISYEVRDLANVERAKA